jgi:hypothetical protein
MTAAGTTLQVGAGLVVVVCLYWAALWILQRDQLVGGELEARPQRQSLLVLDGYAESATVSGRVWSTINPGASGYVPIKRSYNRRGGAQFSYAFWLQVNDTTPANVAGRTLLLRGDSRPYSWVQALQKPDATQGSEGDNPKHTPVTDVLVKCPRIRFGDAFDNLVVEFNTLADPNAQMRIDSQPDPYTDATLRHNLLKLIPSKWVLMTFTFEDNVAISEFEDGIVVRFYLNDTLYQTSRTRSALRQNSGSVYVMPPRNPDDPAMRGTRIADVRYANYAMQLDEVRKLYADGPPKTPAENSKSGSGEPLYLSEYNKLDVYNS